MKNLKLNVRGICLAMAIALVTFSANAQTKTDLMNEFKALEQQANELYEMESLTDEEMKELEQEFGQISDDELKEEEALLDTDQEFEEMTDSEVMSDFLAYYKDVYGSTNLDEVLKEIDKVEKKELRRVKGSEREEIQKAFVAERELAQIEHKMYLVAKQYVQ